MRTKQDIMDDANMLVGASIEGYRELNLQLLLVEVLCDIRQALWFLANANEEDL